MKTCRETGKIDVDSGGIWYTINIDWGWLMKKLIIVAIVLVFVSALTSCQTHKGFRKDDPYLYKRGVWNFSKGGLVDDIPQFLWQILESMFDYGSQPIDAPSMYEAVDVRHYVVVKGDTLKSIANDFFGTSDAWIDIYNANKDIIANPESLVVGQTLSIPLSIGGFSP